MTERVKKPTIFVFTTAYLPFIGGAEVAIEQVARRLCDRFDFIIFTSRMDKNLPKREVRDEGLVVRIGFGWGRFDKYLLMCLGAFYAWRIARSFDRAPGRLIGWVMDFSFGAAAAWFLKIFYPKIPLIFTIQYGYGEERVAKGRWGFMNLAFRLILIQADYVTAISSYLLNLCREYGYIGAGAIVHNGVDAQKFQITKSKLQTNSKLQNVKTIITVSRLVPKNGVDVLIDAVAKIVRGEKPPPQPLPLTKGEGKGEGVNHSSNFQSPTSNLQLHIIGDGPERKSLERMAYGLGLTANVRFFGVIPYYELPKYLADADIFARPSRSEGMGNAFVEALAAGLPIIGTPVGGIPDIIRDGETGLFSRVDDPGDLAEKIKILLTDKKLAARIVENGRKMVAERFSWDKIAQAYAEVFSHELDIKKRILIATGIFPPDVGGPATYSKILLDELPKQKFGVRILSFGSVKYLPKGIRHIVYFIKALRLGGNADIIFAQDPVSVGLPAMIAAKILRKKFLLKIVGDYAWEQGVQRFGVKEVLDDFLKNKYGWKVEFLRKIQKFVSNRAAKIIVPSKYLKGVVEKWGVNPEKISVVYNAVDFKNIGRTQGHPMSRTLVSASRLVPWKGFGTLVEIMPDLVKKFPDLKLVIIGDGPERRNLEKKIINLKLGGITHPGATPPSPREGENGEGCSVSGTSVILTGALLREKVLEYLAAADVFVLNTAYEGFSHQILEAMALGVPVVTTDAGGNPELVGDGKEGFLIKFDDKKAMKQKILDILSNPALAKKFADNAQKKAREFSLVRMIGNTVLILDAA